MGYEEALAEATETPMDFDDTEDMESPKQDDNQTNLSINISDNSARGLQPPTIKISKRIIGSEVLTRRCLPTAGRGDCGLHAVLGKPGEDGVVHCQNIPSARKQMCQVIKAGALINTSDPNRHAAFRALIVNGIRDWIMSDAVLNPGNKAQTLRTHFRNHLNNQNQEASTSWQRFEEILRENREVYAYIEQYHRLQNKSEPFHRKFSSALLDQTEENTMTLRGMIYSIPSLEEAFQAWNRATQAEYDWVSEIAKYPEVKSEFASFVGRVSQWLAPLELNIIACVFDRTVRYQPAPSAAWEVFNPGCEIMVSVAFDGVGHFERVIENESLGERLMS
jgi:hypothetical protein